LSEETDSALCVTIPSTVSHRNPLASGGWVTRDPIDAIDSHPQGTGNNGNNGNNADSAGEWEEV